MVKCRHCYFMTMAVTGKNATALFQFFFSPDQKGLFSNNKKNHKDTCFSDQFMVAFCDLWCNWHEIFNVEFWFDSNQIVINSLIWIVECLMFWVGFYSSIIYLYVYIVFVYTCIWVLSRDTCSRFYFCYFLSSENRTCFKSCTWIWISNSFGNWNKDLMVD